MKSPKIIVFFYKKESFVEMLEEIVNTTDLTVDARFLETKSGRKFIGATPAVKFEKDIRIVPPAKESSEKGFDIIPLGNEIRQVLKLETDKAKNNEDLEIIIFKYNLQNLSEEKNEANERTTKKT
ncbi:MAG TPA: hypothetical protein P5136_01050 [Methanofastidiosum sp.]|nr:hypothetical protein [Methanofastidiosum sp.]